MFKRWYLITNKKMKTRIYATPAVKGLTLLPASDAYIRHYIYASSFKITRRGNMKDKSIAAYIIHGSVETT